MNDSTRLSLSLLALRIGVAIVMGIWAVDKIVQPEHAARVFENFYGLSGLGQTAFLVIGIAQLLLVAAFLFGIAKRVSYGAVLVLHAISTFSSYAQYLNPFANLLFFAAWPMLAACLALYLLRDRDTWMTIGGR